MTGTRLALAALAALLAAGAATAGPPDGRRGAHGAHGPMGGGFGRLDFAAIDADGDGSLSRAELQARAVDRLAVFDLNGDGALDRAEIVAAFPQRGGALAIFSVDPAEEMADRILAMSGATAAGQVAVSALAEEQVNMLFVRLDRSRDDAISVEEADQGRRGPGWMRGRGGPDMPEN